MLLLLALACHGDKAETGEARGPFPESFLWGTATAGFQVDPGCPTLPAEDCEDRASDWYQWVTDPDLVAEPDLYLSGEPLGDGPGFRELYEEDLDRARNELHNNAIRLSVEWSRLFPDASAEAATSVDELAAYADPDGLAYTNAVIDAARARGLTVMLTLNHYTLPLWIHDGAACHEDPDGCVDRGWMDPDRLIPAIALYAGFCAREFGDRVDLWATENEPLAIVLAGYLLPGEDRTNPPAISDADAAVEVLFSLARGHQAMYAAIQAEDGGDADGDGVDAQVGVVTNLVAVAPKDETRELDVHAASDADYVYNRAYLDAAALGEFDTNLDGTADSVEPDVAGRMDFIGVNYYTRITVLGLGVSIYPDYPSMDFLPTTLWEDYPEGIAEVAALAAGYGVPVYITENGTGSHLDGADVAYLEDHVAALAGAVEDGLDVRGYFYWSLIDNYEWNHGMSDYQFGLYGVDLDSKARTLRDVGARYAEIAERGGL